VDSSFAQIDSWIVAIVLAVAMLGGWALGWWIGRRNPADPDEKSSGRFVDGSMALFGLLLGFTFAMALGKHDQRRLMIIADSNSIGDFYTCASLLKDPKRTPLQEAIREYVTIRVHAIRGHQDRATTDKAILDSEKLHQRMTNLVADAVNADTPVAIPLVNTLNGLTSSHASVLAAVHDRLPLAVLLLLFAAAVISTILVGRHHGARQKLHIAGTVCYVLLTALAVCVILDLNRPFKGLITVSYEPLDRLAASIAK
jgi:hypothetical protein